MFFIQIGWGIYSKSQFLKTDTHQCTKIIGHGLWRRIMWMRQPERVKNFMEQNLLYL